MAAEETIEEKRAFIESLMGALEVLVATERRVAWMLATGVAAKICHECRERDADALAEEEILRLGLGEHRERVMAEVYAGEKELNDAYKKARELLLSGLEELGAPARPA